MIISHVKTMCFSILVIDDDSESLPQLRETLELENHQVKMAQTGAEALQLLETFTPDLILAALDLPDIKGLDLLGQIRLRLPQTPLIFLSAHAQAIDILGGLDLGAEDYIMKPVRSRDLLRRIRRTLARTAEAGVPAYVQAWPDNILELGQFPVKPEPDSFHQRGLDRSFWLYMRGSA